MYFKVLVEIENKWIPFTWEELAGKDFAKNRKRFWTTLTDKNGKEIYEGDIIKYTLPEEYFKGAEIFKKVGWGVDHWHVIGTSFSLNELFSHISGNIEVVGNIYENTELVRLTETKQLNRKPLNFKK